MMKLMELLLRTTVVVMMQATVMMRASMMVMVSVILRHACPESLSFTTVKLIITTMDMMTGYDRLKRSPQSHSN